ncbi:hypothetical protein [Actinomadura sp. 3N508]|uniref:hypothetical protein n=1 Tax=Actinomadura sp. 3N508 TaxID=3375153 RepID=UPI00379F0F54
MNRNENHSPIKVTAKERRHLAYKLLARAAIALARVELASKKPANQTEPKDKKRGEDDQ